MSTTPQPQPDDPRHIEIEDIGPNESLRLFAKPGRVTVLRGRNGTGKTQALDTITALQTKKGRLEHRDGTVKGVARGLGVQIRVTPANTNRRIGELLIDSLESTFSIADLVNPPFKSVDARESHRLKALAQIAGCDADITQFYDLVGGRMQFDVIVDPSVRDTTDPVDMAAAVKRDFEKASREKANEAETLRLSIRSKHDQNEGINMESPHNRDDLDTELTDAITNRATLNANAEHAHESQQAAEKALVALKEAKNQYDGPAVDQAVGNARTAETQVDSHRLIIERLTKELAAANSELYRRETVATAMKLSLTQAESHYKTLAAWRKTIHSVQEPPPESALSEAARAVTTCREAVETGMLIREAIVRKAEADVDSQRATKIEAQADSLRDASLSVETVLSRAVKELEIGLDVNHELRLVTETNRGATYFDKLSEGERWPIAIRIVVDMFRRSGLPGLIVLPQECWQDVDGPTRKIIAESIVGTDLAIITAEADHDLDAPDGIAVKTFGCEPHEEK